MATIERRNIIGMQKVGALLAQDLIANGFDALGVNQTANTSIDVETFEDCLLAPTETVDPVAVEYGASSSIPEEVRQPWRLMIEADNANGEIRIFANTPTNVVMENDTYRPSVFGTGNTTSGEKLSGLLSLNSVDGMTSADITYYDSVDRTTKTRASTFNVASWGIDLKKLDYESIPFSYRLTVSSHGIAFLMWIESRDSQGDAFGWFVIQRMVDSTGAPVVQAESNGTELKAPLFCVFAPNGGGGLKRAGDPLNTPDPKGILQFVVRESDVNAPTIPQSATVDSADSSRIINSVQQVATTENNSFVLRTLRGLCTQRNAYPYELDLLCYTSADVVPQWNEPKSTLFGEANPRTYKAMNANHPNNKGMRILMLIDGPPLA
jgi:hypothetical protein